MKKNVLLIGNGSRENALAWKISQSEKLEKLYIAPGNPGTAGFGENVNIQVADISALADFAQKNNVDLTVVGPEEPLSLGIVDEFQKRDLKIWGPSKAAAQIESSKAFSKELMKKAGVPTAEYEIFSNYDEALKYIEQYFSVSSRPTPNASEDEWRDPLTSEIRDSSARMHSLGMTQTPIVIKASGLALGKGVTVCQNLDEAKKVLKEAMVDKTFGQAGSEVVIEEFLQGREFSTHAFCDGENFIMLPSSQDHKRIFDGDLGPNTGGVGTITPLPWVTKDDMDTIARTIVAPILKALEETGAPFTGLLYPGLMMTKTGPKVIEFNCRFGGPECESYMRILKTDILDIFEACVYGKLKDLDIDWEPQSCCCIILCSKGYPEKYEKGFEISGIDEAEKVPAVKVFQAGTKLDGDKLVTNGGRVLGVTATGNDLQSALKKAYEAVKLIHFEGIYYRTDIGAKSL